MSRPKNKKKNKTKNGWGGNNHTCLLRIQREKKIVLLTQEKGINKTNRIYVKFDDTDIYHLRALVLGPTETPYENGYFFFDIWLDEDHPFKHPKAKFQTNDGRVRFNPNLYTNGKVCVSILGTWQGPGWSATFSIETVLVTLQSLMGERPIENEPGYEKAQKKTVENYNTRVAHATIRLAVIGMLRNPPKGFEVFKDIQIKHFFKDYRYFRTTCEERMTQKVEGTTVKGVYGSFTERIRYKELRIELEQLYEELKKSHGHLLDEVDSEENEKLQKERLAQITKDQANGSNLPGDEFGAQPGAGGAEFVAKKPSSLFPGINLNGYDEEEEEAFVDDDFGEFEAFDDEDNDTGMQGGENEE